MTVAATVAVGDVGHVRHGIFCVYFCTFHLGFSSHAFDSVLIDFWSGLFLGEEHDIAVG